MTDMAGGNQTQLEKNQFKRLNTTSAMAEV